MRLMDNLPSEIEMQKGEERGKIKAFYELGFDVKEISKRLNKPEEEIITIIRNK